MAASAVERLTNPGELLFRQVNPAFIHKDRVSSQAFCPTKKDDGLLSTSRESVTTPDEAAYGLYMEGLGFRSAGVWGVTVGECEEQQLSCYADPVVEPVEDPAHCFVDFQSESRRQARRKGKILAYAAQARGALYSP